MTTAGASPTSASAAFAARVADLAERFRGQVEFAQGYSPLYARLFGLFVSRLTAPGLAEDSLVQWLVAASSGRQAFSVPLLLAAGLHRLVLSGRESAAGLSRYFPTAGGHRTHTEDSFPAQVHATIQQNELELANFLQVADVQTNETGRGLAWLLPLSYCNWPAVHLLDLGASAGLNLLADYRAYRLKAGDGTVLLDVGAGSPVQFQTICRGAPPELLAGGRLPGIVQRLGYDLAPFQLAGIEDELTLMSFVWGDQPKRLQRLREGIAAYHVARESDTPVQLIQASLPGELADVLHALNLRAPLVLYNTTITYYLEDKGASMRDIIDSWATQQAQSVLWLQWEPAWGTSATPEYGWCAWTADLWQGRNHYHWRLGWVHPHGTEAQFEQDLVDWMKFWS